MANQAIHAAILKEAVRLLRIAAPLLLQEKTPPKRVCGSCTLCCTLLAVDTIEKPVRTPCKHLCAKGCAIYEIKPVPCTLYKCGWLEGILPPEYRPDKIGALIDIERVGENAPIIHVYVQDRARLDSFHVQVLTVLAGYLAQQLGLEAFVLYDDIGPDGGQDAHHFGLNAEGWKPVRLFTKKSLNEASVAPSAGSLTSDCSSSGS